MTMQIYQPSGGGVSAGEIDGTHLSQTFGASAGRLYNYIPNPIAGEVIRIGHAGAPSPFAANIAGAPSSTEVVYDGDSNENLFTNLEAYDGAAYWGQIILYNTTRGNSRKIVSVDRGTNTITTTASVDDWGDNDVLTTDSPTVGSGGYFDVDVSAQVGVGVAAIIVLMTMQDQDNSYDNYRGWTLHPFEAYNAGKRAEIWADLALENSKYTCVVPVNSQKISMNVNAGNDAFIKMAVFATVEFADT